MSEQNAACAECSTGADLRARLTAIHRRAQSAERGLLARLEPGERTLGRALANSAAVMYREQLRELVEALCAYVQQHGLEHDDEQCPQDDTCACPLWLGVSRALDVGIAAVGRKR